MKKSFIFVLVGYLKIIDQLNFETTLVLNKVYYKKLKLVYSMKESPANLKQTRGKFVKTFTTVPTPKLEYQ